MIYLIDEDISQLQALVATLELSGFKVAQIDNADDALRHLSSATDVELVLIDVMLGTNDAAVSAFNRSDTQDFLITGLNLADKLVTARADIYPSRLAFLSMASRPHVVDQIREKARELNVKYFDKRDIGEGIFAFVKRIENLVKNTAR